MSYDRLRNLVGRYGTLDEDYFHDNYLFVRRKETKSVEFGVKTGNIQINGRSSSTSHSRLSMKVYDLRIVSVYSRSL